ncbi:MAG: hypothetical protein WC764_03035 [Candidatus Paceibacterota bacterium]|jgi:hypothetical protein
METRTCQNCKQNFVIEPEDFEFYEKIKVPPPTFCPECRNIQRLATRNMKSLYRRACDKCGENVVSRFSSSNRARMFCHKCWWAEDWDGISFGKDYDFSRPFFEQFNELLFNVPHVSILNSNMVESDYSNMETDCKKCYLTFGGHYNENCAFTVYSLYGKEVYDSYWSLHCEQCLGNTSVNHCYRTFFSEQCGNCIDTFVSRDCRGCTNIIGCAGLRNKQYCIYNRQFSKDDYLKEKSRLNFGSHAELESIISKSHEVWLKTPHQYAAMIKTVNCSGNDIFNSKNVINGWNVEESENCKNAYIAASIKDCYDETSVGNDELGYMNANGGGLYNCKATLYSFSSDPMNRKSGFNCEYSYSLVNCNDCFGCAGLRGKRYCILNKQYTEAEYKNLLPKVIEHMRKAPFVSSANRYIYSYGDFFPAEHSLFAYNESAAQDFYPTQGDKALMAGFNWREEPPTEYKFTDYIIPDDIRDVKDDILNAVLKCEKSGKAYRIIKQELEFYRSIGLPIPRIAPLERINQRINNLLPFKLWERTCGKCSKPIQTPYAPDRPEIVYCESCYQQEVV